ncbi:unnamed protein product, partial [Prorocentrum cordatum]
MESDARLPWRTFTVHGPQMALAMLRGIKPVETRRFSWLRPGWSNLHVGKGPISKYPACQEALRRTWPDAPAEGALLRQCVVGQVHLAKRVPLETVARPWAMPAAGSWCYVIDAARGRPVDWAGQPPAERAPPGAQLGIALELGIGESRCAQTSGCASAQDPATRLPRGMVRRNFFRSAAPTRKRKKKRPVEEGGAPANSPANLPPRVGGQDCRSVAAAGQRAQRVAAGRTLPRLLHLMRMSLLHRPERCVDSADGLRPHGGLFGCIAGDPAFIVGDLHTVKQSEISNVGAHFQAALRSGGQRSSLHFTSWRDEAGCDKAPAQLSRTLAALWGVARDRAQARQRGPGFRNVCVVRPAAVDAHVAEAAARGERHCTAPLADQSKTQFVLDFPLPLQLEVGAHRCQTCHARGARDCCGFPVTLADIRAARPGALALQTKKHGLTLATRVFLLHLLQNFNKVFCAPSNDALRAFICDALENYLGPLVEHVRKHVNVYSGSVVRGDGNWDLAARVRNDQGREFSVILAWIGVDGALLKPVIASKTEDLVDLLPDLDDVVSSLKRDRQEAGLGLAASAPICHSTDVHGKHRLKLAEFYMGKYPEQTSIAVADTPKADGAQAADRISEPLAAIAGDPVHDAAASACA